MLYYLFSTVYVLVCLLLLIVVLLQQGKGGDIATAFSDASSQTTFNAQAKTTVLTRATTVLGTLFMLGAFALGVVGKGASSSVVAGEKAPVQAAPAAPALPMETTPPPPPAGSGSAGSGAGSATGSGSASGSEAGKTDPGKAPQTAQPGTGSK